jgi:protein-disulfide isomerase
MTSANSSTNTVLKNLGIGLGVLAILGLCVYGLMRLGASSNPSGVTGGAIPPVSSSDWTRGNQYAKNVLIEYSDLQCPACGAYEPLVQQLMKDLNGQILLVYRHYPLTQVHPHAQIAAQATEAAGLQGKFWEMHDILFSRQSDWANANNTEDLFKGYAKQLGMDENKFASDLNSDTVKKLVAEDADAGLRAGIDSTPTFYLNGSKVQNPGTYEELKALFTNAK